MFEKPAVRPVILGGDIGAYSLARTFHEAYGVRSIAISTIRTVPLRYSQIVENILVPDISNIPQLIARLRAIAADHPGEPLLLLGTSDWHVRTIVENRTQLEDLYAIPYVQRRVLDIMTSKEHFASLCAELGVDHPTTVIHDVQGGGAPDVSGLTFPVIAKAADTTAYHEVEFPGQLKVFTVEDEPALLQLLATVKAAGYRGSFVIQDLIPGDDSGMRILTTYSDRTGHVRLASFGHVLLEEHTPSALGNPVGILSDHDEEIVAQATRLLERVGWTGYANFDLKFDPRDGRTVFFELNPRLGRSNYYVTTGGNNPAFAYVREYLQGVDPVPAGEPNRNAPDRLFCLVPRRLLRRYVSDPQVRGKVRRLGRTGNARNPMWYKAERDPRRWAIVALAQFNQTRKFRRYWPVPASTKAQAAPAPAPRVTAAAGPDQRIAP